MGKRNKLSVGQKVEVEIWHEAVNHWDWPWPETLTGTVATLPNPSHNNNWNYNPTEFDIRTGDGEIVHIKKPRKVKAL